MKHQRISFNLLFPLLNLAQAGAFTAPAAPRPVAAAPVTPTPAVAPVVAAPTSLQRPRMAQLIDTLPAAPRDEVSAQTVQMSPTQPDTKPAGLVTQQQQYVNRVPGVTTARLPAGPTAY